MEQAAALPLEEPGRLAHEFRTWPRAQQRRLLIQLIEQGRSDDQIGSLLGLSQWQVRNLRYRLGIKKDRGGNLHLEPAEEPAGDPQLQAAEAAAAAPEAGSGLTLALAGTYRADQLARRCDALRALFEAAGADRRYLVRIQVSELPAERGEGAAGAAPA